MLTPYFEKQRSLVVDSLQVGGCDHLQMQVQTPIVAMKSVATQTGF
jgi:hypothetical protein